MQKFHDFSTLQNGVSYKASTQEASQRTTEREIVQGCGNAMAVPAIGNIIRATILFMGSMGDDSSSS